MAAIKKRVINSNSNYEKIIRYLKKIKRVEHVANFIDSGYYSDVYHYAGCTVVLTGYISRIYDNSIHLAKRLTKIGEIELEVFSDTKLQSKKVFCELEKILANK